MNNLNGTIISFEELAIAFMDILDGATWHDLQHITGLSEERCKDIMKVYSELSENSFGN